MSDETLSETEKLLLMAADYQALGPETNVFFANTYLVVHQVLRWLGLDDEQIRLGWQEESEGWCTSPTHDAVYNALVRMTYQFPSRPQERPGPALFEGGGNWGVPGLHPPCYPFYNSCRLTERGQQLAKELLAQHPQYLTAPKVERIVKSPGLSPSHFVYFRGEDMDKLRSHLEIVLGFKLAEEPEQSEPEAPVFGAPLHDHIRYWLSTNREIDWDYDEPPDPDLRDYKYCLSIASEIEETDRPLRSLVSGERLEAVGREVQNTTFQQFGWHSALVRSLDELIAIVPSASADRP